MDGASRFRRLAGISDRLKISARAESIGSKTLRS